MANINTEIDNLEEIRGDRLTKEEAVAYLGIGRRTLERWVSQGKLHAEKVGHFALFKSDEVEALRRELLDKTTHKGRTTPYRETMQDDKRSAITAGVCSRASRR